MIRKERSEGKNAQARLREIRTLRRRSGEGKNGVTGTLDLDTLFTEYLL